MSQMASAGLLHDQSASSLLAALRETDLENANAKRKITFKFSDGCTVDLNLEKHFKNGYKDECKDETLPPEGA